ncbi:TRAP transporter large permease subunit [Oceanobacillus damuensis]|uniref:TRAP transporter large permease subunit n=1 Tax=Oceanobacillus damuensis TaxID=937928 RepID=UPI0008317F98|nr:TRAP transporter large permease subunit [Oceanobacillus damuensis]
MSNFSIRKILGVLYFITIILYIIELFWYSKQLYLIISSFAFILLIFAYFFTTKSNKIIVFLLLFAGTLIFIYNKLPLSEFIYGFGNNVNIIALFLAVPFLSTIISVGGYLQAIKQQLLNQTNKLKNLPYILSGFLSNCLSIIFNIGSMPIVNKIAEESFNSFKKKKLALTLMRSSAAVAFWSPYYVGVGLVLSIYELSWLDIGWITILIAVSYLLISLFFLKQLNFVDDIENERVNNSNTITDKSASNKVIYLLIWTAVLLIISFLLDYYLPINMLNSVSIVSMILPIIWSISIKVFKTYMKHVRKLILNSFDQSKNEIIIFISAGYFGVALSNTDVGHSIADIIINISFGSIYIMSIILVFFTMLLSFCGIHPVIVAIGLGSSLSPELFGVNSIYMAVILLISMGLGYNISPFSAITLMTSNLTGVSPINIVKINSVYILLSAFILPLLLYLVFIFLYK